MKSWILISIALCGLFVNEKATARDQRTDHSDAFILDRLFPKQGVIELGTDVGFVLNPAFVETRILQVSMRYFITETWGLGLGVGMAAANDRNERVCVESFYNDPDHEVDAPCAAVDEGDGLATAKTANIGPAYVPIREIRQMVTLYADYTLAYGKLILLHGATTHFDLRLRFGGGMTISDVYDERTYVRGRPDLQTRGALPPEGSTEPKPGVGPQDQDGDGLYYGKEGRDQPRQEKVPHLYLGFAEELLFFRRFFLEGELAGLVFLGTSSGFTPVLLARFGMGVRF